MDLTQGAIEAIQKPVREAESLTKQLTVVDHPDQRLKLLVQSGKHEKVIVPPPFRRHSVATLADLIAYANHEQESRAVDDPEQEAPTARTVVWHSADKVVLVLDDEDRRDTVTFPLLLSDAWKMLLQLETQPEPMTQRTFITLLRRYLGCGPGTTQQFRKLNFHSKSDAVAETMRTRESLGNSVEAEVIGTSELPDDLIVEVPIYASQGERQAYPVRLLLDYDVQTQRIAAVPEADLLDTLVDRHQSDIHDRLRSELIDVPVYYGSP
jgi:hypothetical protein